MDFISTKFYKKKLDNKNKCQRMKSSLKEQVQLRGGEARSKKKKYEFVPKEVWDKQKVEERYIKYARTNHQARVCKALSRAKTALFPSNTNQKPVQKKRKFDKRHVKRTEPELEQDTGNK